MTRNTHNGSIRDKGIVNPLPNNAVNSPNAVPIAAHPTTG